MNEIGAIIGRFQVHELHEAHQHLIDQVLEKHKKVIIFLGVPVVLGTRQNPLDFDSRRKMIQEVYGDKVSVIPLQDVGNDYIWSKNLDSRIKEIHPLGEVTLYGGRDSFIPHYKGKYKTEELHQEVYVSGTEIRKELSDEVRSSSDFRAGVIYNSYNQYNRVFPTVDIAPFKSSENKILLAKKPHEDKYRFIGGFVNPGESLERAAKREFNEETGGAEINELTYVCSQPVDDWRYRDTNDGITTTLFKGEFMYGRIVPSDDISELKWFDIEELTSEGGIVQNIMPEHTKLMISLLSDIKAFEKEKV